MFIMRLLLQCVVVVRTESSSRKKEAPKEGNLIKKSVVWSSLIRIWVGGESFFVVRLERQKQTLNGAS